MTEQTRIVDLPAAQAADLAILVDLEARWENLRTTPTPAARSSLQELHTKQKAYDAFRVKLTAFNKKYAPAHVAELLLNNPVRLGIWCRKMAELYRRVEQDARVQYPTNLLEKAYRCASKIADRTGKERPGRPTPAPETVRDAVAELDTLARWCDESAGADGSVR